MPYRVEATPAAHRQLSKLPATVAEKIRTALRALSINPRPHGSTKLAGPDTLYRIRIGDYRAIYEINDATVTVLVVAVGHRREIYS